MKLERAAHWAEIFGNLGVVVTLVFLVLQVADNSRAIRSQALFERNKAITAPFLVESDLPEILAKIKAADGPEPWAQAFMDKYGLTYAETAVFGRAIMQLWSTLEAEYVLVGDSEGLARRIRVLLKFPDNQLWYQTGGVDWLNSDEFRAYVKETAQRDAAELEGAGKE